MQQEHYALLMINFFGLAAGKKVELKEKKR